MQSMCFRLSVFLSSQRMRPCHNQLQRQRQAKLLICFFRWKVMVPKVTPYDVDLGPVSFLSRPSRCLRDKRPKQYPTVEHSEVIQKCKARRRCCCSPGKCLVSWGTAFVPNNIQPSNTLKCKRPKQYPTVEHSEVIQKCKARRRCCCSLGKCLMSWERAFEQRKHRQGSSHLLQGEGITQWLERRTRGRKVLGSSPGRSGGRIFFSRVNVPC